MEYQKKNSNITPSKRHYICYDSRKIKKKIESVKRFHGTSGRASVDIRSAVAYFCGGRSTTKQENS